MDEVSDILDISINYANPYDQVPDIERNNWVVQERLIIAYYRISYLKKMLMIRHLVMISTTKLNLFPDKGVILAYYYPHMIQNQRNWDYKKNCQYKFGSYV